MTLTRKWIKGWGEGEQNALTVVVDARAAGDHIRPVASLAKHAVDALVRTNLLAQHGNGIVRQAHGVEGVYAVPRLHGGVGGAPLEAHAPLDVGEHLDGGDALDAVLEQVLRPRVRHEARRGAGVGPAADEVQLAAAALLGGGAEQTDTGCRCVARPGGVEGGDEAQEAG